MRNFSLFIVIVLSGFILQPLALQAGDKKQYQNRWGAQEGWSTFARGGGVYQFDSDLEEGGSYTVSRINIQAGRTYAWNRQRSISLALSYSNDSYSFSGGNGPSIAGLDPWKSIHTLSMSAPLRIAINDEWSTLFIPSIRSAGESGANFDETITGGAFAGVAYKFGTLLTLGAGVGMFSQLEDSASIFPVLIINWKITDRLSLGTGSGLAATRGPGLSLNYRASQKWKFAIGGRYEKLRFRLDKNGTTPNGVGEDQAFPLFANGTYNLSPKATLSFVGGVELGCELQIEDAGGDSLANESSHPALFGGVTFSLRL